MSSYYSSVELRDKSEVVHPILLSNFMTVQDCEKEFYRKMTLSYMAFSCDNLQSDIMRLI